MATKNNIRSIRFSDELAELIDRQLGDTFTQKFENLITRCVYELPKKEEQLAWYDQEIKKRRKQLDQLAQRAMKYSEQLNNLERQLLTISETVKKIGEM